MRFPADFIEKVREATDVVALIGQHVRLQRVGQSFRGLCPFPDHNEKTPSFYVSEIKQVYHCFGCKRSGSVFNFLMDFQGLTFPEAVETLAEKANLPIPRTDGATKDFNPYASDQKLDRKKDLLKLNGLVAAHYQNNFLRLPLQSPVQAYVESRHLSDEMIQAFHIGYAAESWNELVDWLHAKRAPVELAAQLGVVKKKSQSGHFDGFRHRLMFPIISATGHVLGFGGRALSEDQQPKYLNSPESPIFSKGKTLYGLHLTAKHIRAENEVIIVEGYMDLIALYQAGIKNVVATMGTALTADHARLVKKLCSKVVVLFDGDQAGQSAAEKSLPIFLQSGLFSRVVQLPNNLDPDEFVVDRGTEAFRTLIQSAPDHLLYFINKQLTDFHGQPSEKYEAFQKVGPLFGYVKDQGLKGLYVQEFADRFAVEEKWVLAQLAGTQRQAAEIKKETIKSKGLAHAPREELFLVQFMLAKERYLKAAIEGRIAPLFSDSQLREVALAIVETYCQNPSDFDRLSASLLMQNHSHEVITSHIGLGEYDFARLDEAGEQQLFEDCLAKLKWRHLRNQSRQILSNLKTEPQVSTQALEAFMRLAQEKQGHKGPDGDQ